MATIKHARKLSLLKIGQKTTNKTVATALDKIQQPKQKIKIKIQKTKMHL